jgi:hypothetical protein
LLNKSVSSLPAQLQRAAFPNHAKPTTIGTLEGAPMAMTLRRDRQCNAPLLARSRSDLLGPVAVGVGDYFHHVTVGVVEIDAAAAV